MSCAAAWQDLYLWNSFDGFLYLLFLYLFLLLFSIFSFPIFSSLFLSIFHDWFLPLGFCNTIHLFPFIVSYRCSLGIGYSHTFVHCEGLLWTSSCVSVYTWCLRWWSILQKDMCSTLYNLSKGCKRRTNAWWKSIWMECSPCAVTIITMCTTRRSDTKQGQQAGAGLAWLCHSWRRRLRTMSTINLSQSCHPPQCLSLSLPYLTVCQCVLLLHVCFSSLFSLSFLHFENSCFCVRLSFCFSRFYPL